MPWDTAMDTAMSQFVAYDSKLYSLDSPTSSNLSRLQPPASFPEPNVPGSHRGGFLDGRHMSTTYTQVQVQQIDYTRSPAPFPSQFQVQPTYPGPISDYASVMIPRLQPVAPQLDMGTVNHYPPPPAAIPQPQVQARAPEYSLHPPPYSGHHDGGFVFTVDISESRYPPGPSGPPYVGRGPSYQVSYPSERAHHLTHQHASQQVPNLPNWPSTPQAQPQRQFDSDREYQDHLYAQLSQPYPIRVAQKKALMVGINYSMHPDPRFRLNWGINDAYEIARFLQERCGFHRNNMRILTDDQHDNLPTKANILAAMHWLVDGAQPGDSLFFYFSGHATQVKDLDGDESDGNDECLCTMEYMDMQLISSPTTPGIIVDDVIHDIMVKPLPPGCRLTAVLDCCHSGTLLDLPFNYDSLGDLESCSQRVIDLKSSEADVISLSACEDSERAFEAREGGALRTAFIEYVKSSGYRDSYLDVIQSLHAYMRANNFNQKPQLSSSHEININQRFII